MVRGVHGLATGGPPRAPYSATGKDQIVSPVLARDTRERFPGSHIRGLQGNLRRAAAVEVVLRVGTRALMTGARNASARSFSLFLGGPRFTLRSQQRHQDARSNDGRNHEKRDFRFNMVPFRDEHLESDKAEDEGKSHL